eukprot:Partr_v1_DN25845_c0_g1_i1_m2936 putative surfeit locus protein
MDTLARIQAHSLFFDDIVSMIPSKFYLTAPVEMTSNPRFVHKKTKVQLEVQKVQKKESKAKKLDPEIPTCTTLIHQQEQAASTPASVASLPTSLPISELKARLHAKIALMRAERKANKESSGGSAAGNSNLEPVVARGREKIVEQRRLDKLARLEVIQKRKLELSSPSSSAVGNLEKSGDAKSSGSSLKKRDGLNAGDSIEVGKIEFDDEDVDGKRKKVKIDPKVALNKLQTQQAKLERLKSKNSQKAELIETDAKWNKSLALASGEKLQDDPKLLKKTIKKREKMKEKSKKVWSDRITKEKKSIAKKQSTRNENIKKRIDDKKAKNIKKRRGF